MFGYHRRSRSLIPVSEVKEIEDAQLYTGEKEKGLWEAQEEEKDTLEGSTATSRQKRNLNMIYLLFLAEAIMASSLSAQIAVLVPSATGCSTMNVSFLCSILECAYFFGSATGVFWGWASDRLGRRRVALIGLCGMASCCFVMGFAKSFSSFALLRFLAGTISSATTISGLAMLADLTNTSKDRVSVVARLPMVVVCGSIGPLTSNMVRRLAHGQLYGLFAKYPGLSGQIACAGLVFIIAMAEVFLLEETLSCHGIRQFGRKYGDSKQALPSTRSLLADTDDASGMSIVDASDDENAESLPSRIGIMQMLAAPSVLILLASFSLLTLHSSTFEILLPHIGHTSTAHGGMGIECTWLNTVTTIVKALAAVQIMRFVPLFVNKLALLAVYRKVTLIFPLLYAVIPLVGLLVHLAGFTSKLSAIVSIAAMLAKTTFSGAAQVLVILLVLKAAPDATSTGTVIGITSISEIFKALAVSASGISYYLSDGFSILAINASLWSILVIIAVAGILFTTIIRESPRIGADIPEDCLTWEGMYNIDCENQMSP